MPDSGLGLIALVQGYALPLLAVVVWIALVVWLGAGRLVALRGEGCCRRGRPGPGSGPRLGARPRPYAGRRRAIAVGQASRWSSRSPPPPTSPATRPVAAAAARRACSRCSCSARDILVLDAKRFRIGGSFTGLVLAMALLGPAPAAALGLASALVDALRRRVRGTYLLNNLLTYTTFPLLGGIAALRARQLGSEAGRLRGRGVRRLPRRERR